MIRVEISSFEVLHGYCFSGPEAVVVECWLSSSLPINFVRAMCNGLDNLPKTDLKATVNLNACEKNDISCMKKNLVW